MNPSKDALLRRRVFLGTLSNYIGQSITFASLFFLTPFILHRLGSDMYGLWVLIGSVIAYGSLFDVGIWGTLIKHVAEYQARGEHEQIQRLVATSLRLYTFLGLAVVLLSIGVAPLLPVLFKIPADQHGVAIKLVILMGVGVGISLPGMAPMSVLRGLQRYEIVNLIDVIITLYTALATVAVLLLSGSVIGLVLVNISAILILMVLSVWFTHRIAPEIRFGWKGADRRLVRSVITYSWPLFVKDFAGRMKNKTDEITIGAFLPVSYVAPYNLGRRLSETTYILTRQFMKVLLPLASELHAENDLARLRGLYIAGTRFTLAISLAIGCTLIILARPLLTIWVGLEYVSAAPLVAILTLASLVGTCGWPAGAVLQGMARHRLLAATSLGSGLMNLALSIALVRPLGLTGVALGTLIPNLIELSIVMPFTLQVLGISAGKAVREIFLPSLSPAVLLILALYTLQEMLQPASILNVLLVAGTGILVYAAGYLSIGATHVERQTFRGVAFSMFRFARAQLKRLGEITLQ